MVTKRKQHSSPRPVKQGCRARAPRPNKIRASTPYNFRGKNLTPYGGLLPVATLLEKLGFQALLEETLSVKRITRVMSLYQFVLALVLGLYVGFARLNQLRFIARDPILTGILQVTRLPPQSTLWRFLASLHLNVARQILSMQRQLRERAWAAANVRLTTVTLDTDTTVHTLYGQQMGGRKSYNPKNKGKRSYQPILTFLAYSQPVGCSVCSTRLSATTITPRCASQWLFNFDEVSAGTVVPDIAGFGLLKRDETPDAA